MLSRRFCGLVFALFFLSSLFNLPAVIRDGGIDPANLGKGEWIYSMKDATNKLGGHISSVVSETTLFQYYKSIGVRYIMVKMGTGSTNYSGCYASPNQITSKMLSAAHSNSVWVFGYTRSYGSDIPGESALADYCFNAGADGFVFDAEAEWESNQTWIGSNGGTLAWQLCSMVRSNWPNKFLGHAPFPIIALHSSFPYKEFGYWCDAIMPQIYHFSTTGIQDSPSAAINWSDVNWRSWQNSLTGTSAIINGETIYWTNSIKPIVPVQDVYGVAGTAITRCNGSTSAYPPNDVLEFIDYCQADPNCQTVGGYKGINFWRADLHDAEQFGYIASGSSGDFPLIVNNIVMDDADTVRVGTWTKVLVFSATTSTPTYTGDGSGTDHNPFGTNYWTRVQGTGAGYMQFTPPVLTAGDYNLYQWHPTRSDASATVPVIVNYDGGTASLTIDQTTNAGTWSFMARLPFAAGGTGTIRFTDGFSEAGAVALVDGLKMVFVPPTAVPATPAGLVATTISSSQINLRWSDTSSNETGFVIFRSTTNGGPYSAVGTVTRNVTNFSDINLSASTPYYYVVRGTNYLGLSASSAQATATTISASGPPSISSSPVSQSVAAGSNALFSVSATGTPPLLYQWFLNGSNIVSAINSSYTRTNVQSTDAGGYLAVVSNAFGSATSSVATLTVIIPPSISSGPQSRTNIAGTTATFTVASAGTSPTFRWLKNGGSMADGGTVSGATTATLQIGNVSQANAATYSVIVSNFAGSATSSGATLTVIDPPSLITQPQNQTVAVNDSATFSATANGSFPLFFQWRFNNAPIAAGTSSSYSLNSAQYSNGGSYSLIVSNAAGSVVSSNATLTVLTGKRSVIVSNIWNIQAGSRTYVTTGSTERGICLNPFTSHALIVSRSAQLAGSLGIFILNASNGTELGNMSTSGITNTAIFKLNKIDVAGDGVIYGANLTVDSTAAPLVIYRWANEASTPTIAYSGAPDAGTTARWGDSFSVTGAGVNTRILISGSAAVNAMLFTTTNGSSFAVNRIDPNPSVAAAEFARGLYLDGGTFYTKNRATNIAQVYTYNVASNSASVNAGIAPLDSNMLAIVAVTNYDLLAGVVDDNTTNNAGHGLKVYDVSSPASPLLVSNFTFLPFGSGTNNANANFAATADTDGSRIIGLDTQNGVIALQILVSNPPPRINSVLLLSGTRRQFALNVDPGNFVVQASSTLTNWIDLTVTRTNGLFEIDDPDATSERFYRVKAQ